MTVAQVASLFNVTAVVVVLMISTWVATRHPRPFFTRWVFAYGIGAFLMAVELATSMTIRPWPLALLEIGLMAVAAWTFYESGRLLRGRALHPYGAAFAALGAMALGGAILLAGLPFPLALTPAIFAFSAALVYVGWAIARHLDPGYQPSTRRFLGASVGLLGLLPLTYPLFERIGIDWVGFWLSGLLHMLVGSSVIIYLLEETSARLRAQNERLLELDQLKSRFVSTVSHELRTPLTSIVGYLELLEDGVGGELPPIQLDYVEQMRASAGHLAGLVDTILDSMRLQHGSLQMRHEAVDVAERAREVIEALRAVADRKGVRLDLAPVAAVPLADADAVRVTQVLMNLVGNAVKFTPKGGRVRVEVQAAGDRVRVAVADTGIGIRADQLAKVFEPFFQVDAGLTREHGGTGLGLSIVGEMVGAMGGEVGVESVVGAGSLFWFTLPVAAAGLPGDGAFDDGFAGEEPLGGEAAGPSIEKAVVVP